MASRISRKIASSNASSFSKPCTGPKDLWERVNKITGRNKTSNTAEQYDAEMLNKHYASVSTDSHYVSPIHKLTVSKFCDFVSEERIFRLLDVGRPTASGMDGLPHWYLRVAAPFISAPLAHLFNLSLSFSYVPPQWRVGVITPVPKVPAPSSCSDFRPITVTPVSYT